MTLYHHHEPPGTCGICDEFAFAHATYWLPAADIMAQHAHWQTCEVARARLAQAHAQLEAKREGGECVGMAPSWLAGGVEVIPAMAELQEVVT